MASRGKDEIFVDRVGI